MSQWAGLGALQMRVHWRTVRFFGKVRKLYMCPVYKWETSLETALVTGSLLLVAPGCHLNNVSAGEFVLRVSRVSANLFLCGVRRVRRTVLWDHRMAEMAMGSDSPAAGRSGVDFQVQLQVSLIAPEAYVNLDSDSAYELKTVPDLLDLHVLPGRDSRSVRALVLEVKVRDRGFHDVALLDMGDIAGPDIYIADLSLLRLQWPVPVVSGMTRLQPELEQLRHDCKKRHCGTQADMCSFCRKRIKLDMSRHVANYHLELAQLWCCLVPASVKTANLGKWFPPFPYRKARILRRASSSGIQMMNHPLTSRMSRLFLCVR